MRRSISNRNWHIHFALNNELERRSIRDQCEAIVLLYNFFSKLFENTWIFLCEKRDKFSQLISLKDFPTDINWSILCCTYLEISTGASFLFLDQRNKNIYSKRKSTIKTRRRRRKNFSVLIVIFIEIDGGKKRGFFQCRANDEIWQRSIFDKPLKEKKRKISEGKMTLLFWKLDNISRHKLIFPENRQNLHHESW